MAKKVLLKNKDGVELIPITRGELVLDASGKQALHSKEFLATDTQPGLTLIHYVEVSKEDSITDNTVECPIIQLKSLTDKVYPITTSDAVVVNSENDTLTNVLNEIKREASGSQLVLDDRPTEGHTTHGVSSDGIFQELKETVGDIYTLLQRL